MTAMARFVFAALLLFLPAPILVVVGASFTSTGYIQFPPEGFSLRWYRAILEEPQWLTALAVSLGLAVAAAILSTTIAFCAALIVTRRKGKMVSAFETAVLAPLLFPHAALGIAMLALVSTFSVYGTFAGLLLVHCIITLPFAYRPISVSIRSVDPAMEEAAMSLGARPATIFFRVALPLARPGIVTALLFTFILSFDEVTVTMFLVGPLISTMPVEIYTFIQESGKPTVAAISTGLITFTLLAVLLLERLVGLQFFVEREAR
jgi:putative spermidine/putrescine transport system permease protein